MYSYGQYCPVARAAEVLAQRWTPLIVREVLAGTTRFNELERGLPGISRSLLAQRLRELVGAGILEKTESADGRAREYRLTPGGRELQRVFDSLGEWGARWAFGEPRPDELDPALLLWFMRRHVRRERLPRRRVVVQFDFHGARRKSLWLVMDPTDVSVCAHHPGFDVDLLVTADVAALYRVWSGRVATAEAMRSGVIELDGPPALARAFWDWFALSPLAGAVRAATETAAGERRP
ncbi:MAG TPA: winged helix-turn-helix transcriptional regulator [Thermomicrobiales bacterium]|jgi:DNA-binding HxlR family transcriptional regulator|nr:winged helix-turn-helix transcriptional regulator [Thermomicrobiales bacterium]